MPSPNEKLAESLDVLETLQQGNRRVFRSDDLSRVHRERLVENGFLQEVMKGWLISSSPDSEPGESTPWHASFWEFCARYCDERFGEQWHLSPEQSLFLHGERTVIPDQLVVHSPKATNNDIKLLFGTTLYDLRESSPLEARHIFARLGRPAAPIVGRIEILWESMRGKVLAAFPKAPGLPADTEAYLHFVNEIYRTDAYHSLSIEGYSVTPALVERVRQGGWDPEHDAGDRRNRDALAARGYWQAFQLVRTGVEKVIAGENATALVRAVHNDWYRELFQPSVTAGLLEAGSLAGYRNTPVFLRGSRYVPPRWEAVRDAMPAFFDLLEKEPEPAVRAVLGHWLFGYIHPYSDGNGRMARFLMNVMLASGGYPWTVIRIRDRKSYLSALDRASIEMDIHPFATFVVHRVQWRLERHDLTFPDPKESFVPERGIVLFYGQDGEAWVRCVITREALDNHFHGEGKDKLEVLRANRQVIEEEVRRKYVAGDTEVDGSILIRSDDLPE